MKATVFGGSGFLGSHVCDKLSDAGYEVFIFDLNSSKWIREDQNMVLGDILNEEDVSEVVKDSQVVFNFAGISDIDEAQKRPVDSVRYNILGNSIILEACRKASVKRFLFASSVYVYSKSGGFYRCGKQACESFVENYNEVFGLEYTILRYGSLYGPRSDHRNSIYRFVHQAITENMMTYQGSPEALREYIHVEDAALASVEIIKQEYANQHIILTGSQPMKVENLLKMISEMLDNSIQIDYMLPSDLNHYEITPYSFNPKMGKKFSPTLNVDLGQGILKLIEEIYHNSHTDLTNINGRLAED